MIVKLVTKVMLTRTTEPSPTDFTTQPGQEIWRVEWTTSRNGKNEQLVQNHHSEAAARRHVQGLLEQRIDGLSEADVYSERL